MELANSKEELFCQYIVAGDSRKDAYVKAGYKASPTATQAAYALFNKFSKKENAYTIKERISEIKLEKLEELGLDRFFATKVIMETIKQLQIESKTAPEAKDRIKAAEVLLVHLKDILKFLDLKELQVNGMLKGTEYQNMSDAELDKAIKNLMAM